MLTLQFRQLDQDLNLQGTDQPILSHGLPIAVIKVSQLHLPHEHVWLSAIVLQQQAMSTLIRSFVNSDSGSCRSFRTVTMQLLLVHHVVHLYTDTLMRAVSSTPPFT